MSETRRIEGALINVRVEVLCWACGGSLKVDENDTLDPSIGHADDCPGMASGRIHLRIHLVHGAA